MPRFRFIDLLMALLVLVVAGGARAWYLSAVVDNGLAPAPLHAQAPVGPMNFARDIEALGKKDGQQPPNLIANLRESQKFKGPAPLSDQEEDTAHVAPGYPWLVANLARWAPEPAQMLRWIQCGMGALTAALYFFFARRAFRSTLVGTLAGLLSAINPFWIINVAELNDGVLASFLLALSLVLGARGSQAGGAATSLVYGLALAGLSLVRAALLPFAVVALLWFLLRCRKLRRGWLCALLAFLGFANGLAPWTMRNYQAFHEVVPIADSAYLHLWIGNNAKATGGPEDEETLRAALPPERLKTLLAESNQAKRYQQLGPDVCDSISADPAGTLRRRLWAALSFFFGEAWLKDQLASRMRAGAQTPQPGEAAAQPKLPEWLEESYPLIVQAALLVMFFLGLLGWRLTFAWRRFARPATLAAIWIPLPYILGHAGALWGPRLPLDGVILCYVAYTLVCFLPRVGSSLRRGGV
jgi:hypothetical protein